MVAMSQKYTTKVGLFLYQYCNILINLCVHVKSSVTKLTIISTNDILVIELINYNKLLYLFLFAVARNRRAFNTSSRTFLNYWSSDR